MSAAQTPTLTSTDIGSPAVRGTTTLTGCSHAADVSTCSAATVQSTSADIWGRADQFRYVHRPLDGDADIVVRVDSVQAGDPMAKAGAMLRGSLARDSQHAAVFVSASSAITFVRRTTNGGLTVRTTGGTVALPVWLKLERRGGVVRALRSSDGSAWTLIGSQTFVMPNVAYGGMALTSRSTSLGATARFSSFRAARATSLPAPWAAQDVGAPSMAGSSGHAGGRFTILGAGRDVWGTADQFQFAYQRMTGDATIVARVASLQAIHAWTKGGVMMRESLAAGSPHASLFVSASNGVAFQRRVTAGATSVHTAGPAVRAPGWVRLERRGDVVTASFSSDGAAWVTIGSELLALPETFYVGLAVTSHDTSRAARAEFDQVAIERTDGNRPPTVVLVAPGDRALFMYPSAVTITAEASDDGAVAAVEFFAGATRIGTDTVAPYSMTWTGAAAGTHVLTAVARDDEGATTTSAPHTITLEAAANAPPSVSLTSPAAGAAYTAPASISVAASALDSDGTIARVDFYAGSAVIGSDTTAPYAITWASVAAGTYDIVAVARDDQGATMTSTARTVVVADATSQVPDRLAFVPSTDHSRVDEYVLRFYAASSGVTGTPVSVVPLGRPAIVAGGIEVDVRAAIDALPRGSYVAVVVAVASAGSSASAPSASFTR